MTRAVSGPPGSPPLIEWAVTGLTLQGQEASGDGYAVKPFPSGVLIAVVDGLGHGREAALATTTALAILEADAHDSVTTLLERSHAALRRTRGVVMSLASFIGQDSTMTWLGVGNVEGVLARAEAEGSLARENLLLRSGVVGYQLPPLRAAVIRVAGGDTLVLATDGVRGGFSEHLNLIDSPQQIADRILALHARSTDDALVLVARYLGGWA